MPHHHANLTREYGSLAPLRAADPLGTRSQLVTARDRAENLARALHEHAECIQRAIIALRAYDARSAAWWRAQANAALHSYPELQADWRI